MLVSTGTKGWNHSHMQWKIRNLFMVLLKTISLNFPIKVLTFIKKNLVISFLILIQNQLSLALYLLLETSSNSVIIFTREMGWRKGNSNYHVLLYNNLRELLQFSLNLIFIIIPIISQYQSSTYFCWIIALCFGKVGFCEIKQIKYGKFISGGFWYERFLLGGILFDGVFVRNVFVKGILSGSFCPGDIGKEVLSENIYNDRTGHY